MLAAAGRTLIGISEHGSNNFSYFPPSNVFFCLFYYFFFFFISSLGQTSTKIYNNCCRAAEVNELNAQWAKLIYSANHKTLETS